MAQGRRFSSRHLPKKPTDAVGAAPHVRKFMVKLFDREDGAAADWPLVAETLLLEAFYALDQSRDNPRSNALLRRIHAGAYDRLAGNAIESMPAILTAPSSELDTQISPQLEI